MKHKLNYYDMKIKYVFIPYRNYLFSSLKYGYIGLNIEDSSVVVVFAPLRLVASYGIWCIGPYDKSWYRSWHCRHASFHVATTL